ncbi:MAG: PBP1A family penicillin-binding protein [Gemmatimonadetes bacterium]|nr:PBP1A family penicillin-binding protein [Gemmatimonadota bacterium]
MIQTRIRNWLKAHPPLVRRLAIALVALASLGTGLAFGAWQAVCRSGCPSLAQIYAWEPMQSTKILARDGRLVAELFQERRTPVSVRALPAHVRQAFLAVEDQQFYRHRGFNPWGMLRANVNNLLRRRITGGGSTITQQLARNMFREDIGFEQRVVRKLKELKVALDLERLYTKDQILEAYLNQINFGHGWWGIETAAQRYFGKSAVALNPAEAALLAALAKSPAYYTPLRHPERAWARRNLALDLMAKQRVLPREEADRWKEAPLPARAHGVEEAQLAPYFVEWVRETLDDRYGSDLYSKGYRIYTTLDLEMQRRATAAMEQGWARIEGPTWYRHPKYADVMKAGGSSAPGRTPYVQGVFIALDVRTGEVRALIGGRDFSDSKFNRAVQAKRQPGSAFKPFVYGTALAAGIPASHVIYDSPVMLELPNGEVYSPRNYDAAFRGPMTLREALRHSVNIVAVKLGQEVGMETVAEYARRMGIETPVPPFPSTAIGAPDVIPLQLAGAYTTFANGGVRVQPRPILRVEDAEGRVLWQSKQEEERVLEPLPAAILRDLLRDVVNHGTGFSVRDPGVGKLPHDVPAAGKTGTTNDATDVWFVGFTPDLLGLVWFGFDLPTKIAPGAAGGRFAAPVWADFMRSVYVDEPLLEKPAGWALPRELTTRVVDRETGKLASDWCPANARYAEIFVPGTEPTEACDTGTEGLFDAPLRALAADSLGDSTRVRLSPRFKFR